MNKEARLGSSFENEIYGEYRTDWEKVGAYAVVVLALGVTLIVFFF